MSANRKSLSKRREKLTRDLTPTPADITPTTSAPTVDTTLDPSMAARNFSKPKQTDLDITTPVQFVQAQADSPDFHLPNQVWMVLSYVAPADKSVTRVGAKNVMIKISGVFGDQENAKKQAEKIRQQAHHKLIDTFIVPLHVWLTIPMPKAAEMYTKKIYADQPVLNKLMEGNWRATENSRKEVAARSERARVANLKRLRAQYGADYQSPQRTDEEMAKEREQMAAQAPPPTADEKEKEKTYTLMDMYMMFAKFLMKGEVSTEPGTSASAEAPPEPGRADIRKMTPEVKSKLFEFKSFVEEEMKVLEAQASSVSAAADALKQ